MRMHAFLALKSCLGETNDRDENSVKRNFLRYNKSFSMAKCYFVYKFSLSRNITFSNSNVIHRLEFNFVIKIKFFK